MYPPAKAMPESNLVEEDLNPFAEETIPLNNISLFCEGNSLENHFFKLKFSLEQNNKFEIKFFKGNCQSSF